MDLPDKNSIDRIAAFERLDRALTVVGFKGWLVLAFFLILTALTLFWSVWGTIPITISGKAIVFNPDSSLTAHSKTTGVVSAIHAFTGDMVHKGDVVAELSNDILVGQLEDQKRIVALIEREKAQATQWPESREKDRLIELRLLQQLQEQVDNLTVRTPEEGKIVWISLTLGSEVVPNVAMFSIQQEFPPSHLKVLGFFPLHSAESIKPGMQAKCALDSVKTEKYGMLEGVVKEVLPYPLSTSERYMQKIPSEPLRKYLLNGSLPVLTVIIEPTANPNTPSGLQWTSRTGPPEPLSEVSIGEVMIVLENAKPISFVFPAFGKSP